ncbi:MAG: DNA replication/repair protein RecF [Actinomycetota bacterium]|nr:DNA replication/repair protein RecF [Actinomycetota bacterium]
MKLVDFRNYAEAEMAFDSGFNLVLGRNGQGKTSLLEGIYCLSAFGSHRTASSSTMIRHEAERALIHARGGIGGKGVKVDAQIGRTGGVKVWIDRQPIARRSAARAPISVIFSPEDLAIVKGSPEERRRFLDNASTVTHPLSAPDRMNFERVLKQRNGALKAARSNPRVGAHLDVWTDQLAAAGALVVRNRVEVLARLEPAIRMRYREVAGSAPPELAYDPSWKEGEAAQDPEATAEELRKALEAAQAGDLERGVTSVGPHRDDLAITLAGADARLYASQGEQRSLALALRLAERDVVARLYGEEPILLLDDVFSELDSYRRSQLAGLVAETGQTVATATTAEAVPLKGGKVVVVAEGRFASGG